MQNYIIVTPRFSDFNMQGILKASVHLDLACESQLAQMAPRYNLPLSSFAAKGLRWHLADFKISFPKVVKSLNPLRVEADVVAIEDNAMIIEFSFFDETRELKYAFGKIRFELVDMKDQPIAISGDIKQSLTQFGRTT